MADTVEVLVILDSIRSAHNVGAIFRTADGAGVKKVVLSGYTPAPIDRFGRVQPEIKKTSLGATESVAWEQVKSGNEIIDLIARLHAEGFLLIAVEQTSQSVPYHKITLPEKVAFIFGNEVEGVSKDWLAAADQIVDLPMSGEKESLNVATTAGIILFSARDFNTQ